MCCAVLSRSVMSDSATPWTETCQAPLSMGILQARILEWVAVSSSRGSSKPRDQTQRSNPGTKPRDQTQGSNPGLLHCRQILYFLSYQESPNIDACIFIYITLIYPERKYPSVIFLNVLFYLFIGHTACGILVPQPGTELMPLPLGAQSPNRWTSRGVPILLFCLRNIPLNLSETWCFLNILSIGKDIKQSIRTVF